MNKIIPQWPYIAVEPIKKKERVLAGGIIVAEDSEKQSEKHAEEGIIHAVYEGTCPVKVGQRVYYKRFAGDVTKIGDKEIVIMEENDLIAIINYE